MNSYSKEIVHKSAMEHQFSQKETDFYLRQKNGKLAQNITSTILLNIPYSIEKTDPESGEKIIIGEITPISKCGNDKLFIIKDGQRLPMSNVNFCLTTDLMYRSSSDSNVFLPNQEKIDQYSPKK